jgi:hypothetical protein
VQHVAKFSICSVDGLLPVARLGRQLVPAVKISVSKDSNWELSSFAKAPLELLLCDDLNANSKLLWIVLNNQANFRPIDKSVLDKRIGIHRATRIRCMAELKDLGFISGTADHLIIHNPIPILRQLRKMDTESRRIVEEEMLEPFTEQPIKPKKQKETRNYVAEATDAWNKYRPANYSKVNRLSAHLLKSIDMHISALGLDAHDYENFFSVLKAGVEHSPFWSTQNSSKTLQSITGIGQPQSKKYQNVHDLYNEGLNHDKGQAVSETDRCDEIVLSSDLRKVIDDYDELHYMYYNLSRSDPDSLDTLTDRIVEAETKLRDAGLDPARFRMKYQLSHWPTDVPEPELSRQRFWIYDDEVQP